jgi:Methyltransferase domain
MSEQAWAAEAAAPLCAWCGASAIPGAGRLARCPACGAATTYPAPDPGELERAYAGWYRPDSGRFSAGGDRLLSLSRGLLAARLDAIAPAGPVLDVGAGDGSLVRALRDRGREAIGLERAGDGDAVVGRDITEFSERAGDWAAVVFWHSLEHLSDAAGAIDRAVELLTPSGVLVVAVPNLASWQSRCFGRSWFHRDLPRHLVHLPVEALTSGLTRRGLVVLRVSHWRGGQILFGWLAGITGLLPGHPDLYSAIRRGEAQGTPISGPRRAGILLAATAAVPLAGLLAAGEIAARAGGTVYVEARRP